MGFCGYIYRMRNNYNTNERNEMNKISKINQLKAANQAERKMLAAKIDWHSRLRRGVLLATSLGISEDDRTEFHDAAIRDAELRLHQMKRFV